MQKRSRARVEKILEATVHLLDTMGLEGVTTNHIAKKAGISVASLYQYFPNKQAVISTVFRQWLDWVMASFDAIEEEYYLKTDALDFFGRLMAGVLKNTRFPYGAENQLSRAMNSSAALAELDRGHGDEVAKRLAGYLKGYGSGWPDKDLIKVGHLFYHMCSLLYRQFGDETIIKREQLLEWSGTMANALISECLGVMNQGESQYREG